MVHLRQTYLLWKLKALEHFWFCYKWRGGSFSFVCGSKKWESRQDSVINSSGCVGSLVEKKCCNENWIGFGLQKLLSPTSGSIPRGISQLAWHTSACTSSGLLFHTVCVPFFPFMQSLSALAAEIHQMEKICQRAAWKRGMSYIYIYMYVRVFKFLQLNFWRKSDWRNFKSLKLLETYTFATLCLWNCITLNWNLRLYKDYIKLSKKMT